LHRREAERLRRDWIIDALKFHAMCSDGYVIDSRRFVPDAVGPFGNGARYPLSGPRHLQRNDEEC
jgi:hypothetical protein